MDIKAQSLEILRHLYGSSRRLSMYPLGHPVTQETLKKPLDALNVIFSFKHSFTIELYKERLLVEGILLDDSVYVSGLAMDMKKHNLSNIAIRSNINIGDLYNLLSGLIAKSGPRDDSLERMLKSNNIDSVSVNIGAPPNLFRFEGPDTPGDSDLKSLSRRIKQLISKNQNIIGAYYMGRLKTDDDVAGYLNVDIRLRFLTGYFKETLLQMDRDSAAELIENIVLSTNWLDDEMDKTMLSGLNSLFKDYLSRKDAGGNLHHIYQLFKRVGAPDAVLEEIFDKTSVVKLRAFRESENILDILKNSDPSLVNPGELKKIVFKLAADKQNEYLTDLIEELLRSINGPTIELRQQGLNLIIAASEVLSGGGFHSEFGALCRDVVRIALSPNDTLEPVELASQMAWQSLKRKRWEELKYIVGTLKGLADDRMQQESKRKLALKNLLDISESTLLEDTMNELLEQDWSDEVGNFFEAFGNLGSRAIVKILASKITHPDINVRSRIIKLLVNMKKESAEVLTGILGEEVGKYDGGLVSDEKWYFYRNILRVLKDINAEEALPYLELMAGWPIIRVRMEIVKTLEGMTAAGTGKLLEKLSSDSEFEVRKVAIIAMGLSGHPDMIQRLMHIFKTIDDCRVLAVASLSRIGDSQSRDLLIEIFENDSLFDELGISKKNKEEIQVAIIKALYRIGDETAVGKLEEYSRKSFTKSLFKKDLLSNTAKIVLGLRENL